MNQIFIRGLEISTTIGAFQWERTIKQCLSIDLYCVAAELPSAEDDALSSTLDYAQICESIHAFSKTAAYQLLESFAEQLILFLQQRFAITSIKLRITKPGAVPYIQAVGVERNWFAADF